MDSLSLKNLTNALSEVDGWQALGVQLDINYHKLKEFGSLPTIEERKLAMLQFWLDTDLQASWEKLLCGLKKMGLNRIVQDIQREYQVHPNHQADTPPVSPSREADIPPVPPGRQADTPPVPPSREADIPPVPAQSEHVASAAPSLSPSQTSVERKREVQREIDTLKGMYDDLLMKTVESFKEKHAETPTFLSKLRTSIGILPSSLKDEHIHFLEKKASEIANATSIDELFIIVSCYSDFYNNSLVAHIIRKFGDDKLREDLQNYAAEFETFCSRTNLSDFVAALTESHEIPPDFSELVLKMGPQWELRTLMDLEEFHKTLKGRSFLASYAVRLMRGKTGSIFLIWSVPRTCSGFLVSSLDRHFLQQCNIEGVTIDGEDLEDYWRRRHYLPAVSSKHVNEFCKGLVWASGEGCLEDVVFLLSTGVEVDSRGQSWMTALMLASEGGHLDVVRELLKAQADVNALDWRGMTALMLATVGGHLDVVRELLKAQADVNALDWWNKTALMLASEGGHLDVVRELLKAQADVNAQDWDGQTALNTAVRWGHTETVSVLVEAGADVNLQEKGGRTALIIAAQRGHTETVSVLVEAGADVNLQEKDGGTALMWASVMGHTDTVRALLSAGAQADLQDEDRGTALINAAWQGYTETVGVLVEAGADVNFQENHGLTALMYAAWRGYTETVSVLVEAGADVNLQENTSGRSAIFYGAEKGDLEIVKLLIQRGANLGLKDKDGVTADEVAEVHGHQAVCDELRKNVRADRRPLSKAVRDHVLATGQLLSALYSYKRLEEKIFRTQKRELARRTQGLDPEIPLPSTSRRKASRRKGVRNPQEHILQEYMPRSAH